MKNTQSRIDALLRRVRRPGRYAGGEYGAIIRPGGNLFRMAVCYPDLYEIGMSNLAVKALYGLANQVEGIACERVFAPDLDLEELLREEGLPLFTIETRAALRDLDLLGFTLGYELTLTNLLNIIDLGGIPLHSSERDDEVPLVLAGGPLSGNPAPYAEFVDAVFVGEGEYFAAEVLPDLVDIKRAGGRKSDLVDRVLKEPAVWSPATGRPARRAVWMGFGRGSGQSLGFPVPSLKIIQQQGTVEIMRGCPTGCRFCQAGYHYRPTRVKQPVDIAAEVDRLVGDCGYDEITLSSLSSGDYGGLVPLVRALNQRYKGQGVSIALPSLKVESVGLDLFAELSEVRRSGLTFALETPGCEGQKAINKEISVDKTIAILREARARGWRNAKFYFMIGLPIGGGEDEAQSIMEVLEHVHRETGMYLHVNVATFIPKPHTPYQWAPQLDESTALRRIMTIRKGLPRRGFKVGYHSPFTSVLEGIVARGDARVARLLEVAFMRGARLDAWEEHLQWDTWRAVIEEADWDVLAEVSRGRTFDERLPWEEIRIGIANSFLKSEWDRSSKGEGTPVCTADCGVPCGICKKDVSVRRGIENPLPIVESAAPKDDQWQRVLFSLSKQGPSRYLSHLDLMSVIERSLRRGGFRIRLSQGHNPKPRIEFASPLALGISSQSEVISADLYEPGSPAEFIKDINPKLPDGLSITHAERVEGTGRRSLASRYWGSDFLVYGDTDTLKHVAEQMDEEETVVSAERSEHQLELRHRHIARKGNGILAVLERALGERPMERKTTIERLRQLAAGQLGGPEDYFSSD